MKLYVTIFITLVTLFASCSRESSPPSLPSTNILHIRKNWGVISLPYLPLYEEPNIQSTVVWLARKGEVFRIHEQSLETEFLYMENNYWYNLHNQNIKGWAFATGLDVFTSQDEAQNASQVLSDGETY